MAVAYVGRIGLMRNRFYNGVDLSIASASIMENLRAVVCDLFYLTQPFNDNELSSACFTQIISKRKAGNYLMYTKVLQDTSTRLTRSNPSFLPKNESA